jgi:hypothetical protein
MFFVVKKRNVSLLSFPFKTNNKLLFNKVYLILTQFNKEVVKLQQKKGENKNAVERIIKIRVKVNSN